MNHHFGIVLLLCFGWSLSHADNTKIYAEGGNADGQPCVFPFKYHDKLYSDCTKDGLSTGRLWCATTSDYNKDKQWGHCPQKEIYAEGGNADGQPCVFPFKYHDKLYSDCTKDGLSTGRLWCATTSDYNKDKQWGHCPQKGAGGTTANSGVDRGEKIAGGCF